MNEFSQFCISQQKELEDQNKRIRLAQKILSSRPDILDQANDEPDSTPVSNERIINTDSSSAAPSTPYSSKRVSTNTKNFVLY